MTAWDRWLDGFARDAEKVARVVGQASPEELRAFLASVQRAHAYLPEPARTDQAHIAAGRMFADGTAWRLILDRRRRKTAGAP